MMKMMRLSMRLITTSRSISLNFAKNTSFRRWRDKSTLSWSKANSSPWNKVSYSLISIFLWSNEMKKTSLIGLLSWPISTLVTFKTVTESLFKKRRSRLLESTTTKLLTGTTPTVVSSKWRQKCMEGSSLKSCPTIWWTTTSTRILRNFWLLWNKQN